MHKFNFHFLAQIPPALLEQVYFTELALDSPIYKRVELLDLIFFKEGPLFEGPIHEAVKLEATIDTFNPELLED